MLIQKNTNWGVVMGIIKNIAITLAVVLLLWFILSCTSSIISYMGNREDFSPGLRYIDDKCRLIDYEVTGDIVRFRYEMCWHSDSEYDLKLWQFAVKFRDEDTAGWLDNEGFLFGKLEAEDDYCIIQSGDTIYVTLLFEGTYLGGSVNTNLSEPDKVAHRSEIIP